MAKRAGDYAAAPANRAAGILLWASSTSIQALWTPKAGVVDLAGTDHVLVYLDNVVQADRGNKRSYTFNTALGYVPRVCVVYVPEQVDFDNAYDPIGNDATQQNCFMAANGGLVDVIIIEIQPTASHLHRPTKSRLGHGNASCLEQGACVR